MTILYNHDFQKPNYGKIKFNFQLILSVLSLADYIEEKVLKFIKFSIFYDVSEYSLIVNFCNISRKIYSIKTFLANKQC
jgi:hypothetical protein